MKPSADKIPTGTIVFRYIVLTILTGSFLAWIIVLLIEQGILTSSTGIRLQGSKSDTDTNKITVQMGSSLSGLQAAKNGFVVVGKIDSGSVAKMAGVQVGDTIVSIDGIHLRDKPQMVYKLTSESPVGDTVNIGLIKNGVHERRVIVLKSDNTFNYLLSLPIALSVIFFLVVGGLIGWMKVRDQIAFLCSIFFLCWGIAYSVDVEYSWLPTWAMIAVLTLQAISEALVFSLGIRLFSIFPNPSRFGKILWRWQWIGFVLFGLVALVSYIDSMSALLDFSAILPITQRAHRLSNWIGGALFVIMLLLIIPLYLSQRKETRDRPQARLKIIELSLLSWVLSMLLLFLFLFIIMIVPKTLDENVPNPIGFVLMIILFVPVVVSTIAVPFSFAYTILTRKIFGIKFILRKGLQHVFLSKGALIVEGAIVFLIVQQIITHGGSTLASSPTSVSAISLSVGILGMLTLNKVNRKVMPAIDRRFFREVLDVKRLLMELNEKLSEIKEREKILEQTASTVLKALHPERVVFLLKEEKSTEFKSVLVIDNEERKAIPPRHSELDSESNPCHAVQTLKQVQGDAGVSGVLKTDDTIIKQLEEKKGWAIIYPDKLDLEKDEDQRLSAVSCELLIAIQGSAGLVGIMGLGGKLSEEPYSKEDRELLMTVTRQMGLALENAELLEVAKREAEQSRDLEIARSVQQNLFPKKLPTPVGWEFAGICKPAKAVGGDYYDIFEAVPGKVVVALGDVSGKGLGASFLMSSVHGSIRTRVTSCINEPLKLIEELNAYLLSSTSKNIFVTLFFGIIGLKTGKLSYVNCGHPPAIVMGKEGNRQERLTRNGPGLSMLASARFTQGECQLQNGDAIVIYSDGVTEAKNNHEEMYEEERLSQLLSNATGLEASTIMEKILNSVETFASGTEQADDISVIVVKRKR